MATYEDYKINGEICGELVFKGLMNKTIVDNKQTMRYLQDEFENLLSNMTSCDSNIPVRNVGRDRKSVVLHYAEICVM